MKKRILGIVLVGVMMFTVPAQAMITDSLVGNNLEGSDIIKITKFLPSHWAGETINRLYEKNELLSYDQELGYDIAIKKGEFAKMLSLALDVRINYLVEPNIKDYFDDIDHDSIYAQHVIDLVTIGVFKSGGSFNLDDNISKEEMVSYLMDVYKYKVGDDYEMSSLETPKFKDSGEINTEFVEKISQAQHHKIILGNGDNTFKPKKNASIAEAATVVLKLSDQLGLKIKKLDIKAEAKLEDKSIDMNIVIENNSKEDAFIEFSSGQRFDFQLLDVKGKILWTWSADKAFIQVLNTMEIKAGETVELGVIISEDEYLEFKDEIVYLKAFITGTSKFVDKMEFEVLINK